LRIKIKDLTIENIQKALDIHALVDRYKTLAPFFWGVLSVFSESSNAHRRCKARQAASEDEDSGGESDDRPFGAQIEDVYESDNASDSELDSEDDDEEESEKKRNIAEAWKQEYREQGFRRAPIFVRNYLASLESYFDMT
jgi:hypothetical protein